MKKLLAIFVLFLILVQVAQAQEPVFKIYLPLVVKGTDMGQPISNAWRIVKPTGTTNLVLNPSAETTGNFASVSGATITRSTTYQKYGLHSYRVQTTGDRDGLELSLSTLTNTAHSVTARIKGTLPRDWGFMLKDSPYLTPTLIEKIGGGWFLYGFVFPASIANGATFVRIGQNGAGSGDFYVDGVQVEALSDYTTYCDGTQEGCAWNGAEHASTSTRSALSAAGGTPQDLYEDYRFFVQQIVGAGASTQTLNVDSYAILPGGELNSIKVESRQFSLIGKFITDKELELHHYRQELLKTLKNVQPGQLLRLQFNGADVQKEISVAYQGGLEGDLAAFYDDFSAEGDDAWTQVQKFTEKANIQFLAPDPYWYEVGESAADLDTNDTATFRLIAGRLKSTGQWDDLGPPNVAGTYTNARAIAEDATYIYFGGNFFNFDNIANADKIVRYNKQTGTYSALGTGMNDDVQALAIGPDGSLYAGGRFTTAGGVAASRIAKWDGAAWSALGTGMDADVLALAIGLDGLLYAGGAFTTAGGVGANYVASWNGAAWSALGTGMDGAVEALAIGLDGVLYAGGAFTTAGGVSANNIAKWDGSSWSALGTGMNNTVWSLAIAPSNGLLYAGGAFTTAGGVSANYVASWNGAAWSALGTGMDVPTVLSLAIGQDGVLYAGGTFSTAGGISLADRVAKWNGSSWSHLDVDLPGSPNVYAILASKYVDPVISQKYDLYLGFDTTGTSNYAGKVSPTNEGNVPAFPQIIFERSSTGLPATIQTLKNETTGKELLFDYDLLAGERLTIDLTPGQKSIVSNFFGDRFDAVLANSDFGTWALNPDDNEVTCFINVSGALYGDMTTAYLLWRDKYDSWD